MSAVFYEKLYMTDVLPGLDMILLNGFEGFKERKRQSTSDQKALAV